MYTKFSAESGLLLLAKAPLPAETVELGKEEGGACAKLELRLLPEDYRRSQFQLEQVIRVLEEETLKVPHIEKLLAIKGIGLIKEHQRRPTVDRRNKGIEDAAKCG